MADASLRSVVVGTLAALLGAVAGHWLDLTTWRAQQHQEDMTRIYESTSDALAHVVYAMDEVGMARSDSANAASGAQRHPVRHQGAQDSDSAPAAARARYAVARRDYNTKAPGLEALVGVYFNDDVRDEFSAMNARLRAYDAVLADSGAVAVQTQADAIHPAVEQFDHDMAALLLHRGPDLNPFHYRIAWKHSRQQVSGTQAR